jgi:hypothetical protein
MMKNKALAAMILFLLLTGFLYGCFCFSHWDPNPKNWDGDDRAMFCFIDAMALVGCCLFFYIDQEAG